MLKENYCDHNMKNYMAEKQLLSTPPPVWMKTKVQITEKTNGTVPSINLHDLFSLYHKNSMLKSQNGPLRATTPYLPKILSTTCIQLPGIQFTASS